MRIAGFCGHCVVVGEAMAHVNVRFFLMEALGRFGGYDGFNHVIETSPVVLFPCS